MPESYETFSPLVFLISGNISGAKSILDNLEDLWDENQYEDEFGVTGGDVWNVFVSSLSLQ